MFKKIFLICLMIPHIYANDHKDIESQTTHHHHHHEARCCDSNYKVKIALIAAFSSIVTSIVALIISQQNRCN